MRPLIIFLALQALTACHSQRQTNCDQTVDSLVIKSSTHAVVARDSAFISSFVDIDSAEITIDRPDSTRVTIRAKGMHRRLQKQSVATRCSTGAHSDSTVLKKHVSERNKVVPAPMPYLTHATFFIILFLSLIYLIARLCKH